MNSIFALLGFLALIATRAELIAKSYKMRNLS